MGKFLFQHVVTLISTDVTYSRAEKTIMWRMFVCFLTVIRVDRKGNFEHGPHSECQHRQRQRGWSQHESDFSDLFIWENCRGQYSPTEKKIKWIGTRKQRERVIHSCEDRKKDRCE